jgi:putative transposase
MRSASRIDRASTYYHWRAQYGGLKAGDVKRLKDMEVENAR